MRIIRKTVGVRKLSFVAWRTEFKDGPMARSLPNSEFVVALHYHSLQIVSTSFKDLPFL